METIQQRCDIRIKGLPLGWDVVDFHECRCGHDRDAVVLCRRTVDDGDHGTDYVVWWVNMEFGGCCTGKYTDNLDEARCEFNRRKGTLR